MSKYRYLVEIKMLDDTKRYVKVHECSEMKLVKNKADADQFESKHVANLVNHLFWERVTAKGFNQWEQKGYNTRETICIKKRVPNE